MALIGYARVSTHEQHLHLQQDALSVAGCLKIFTDTVSGAKSERKGLAEALEYIRKEDTLVVWRLDRLGRSLKDLIERITKLDSQNIGFKSLTENIDTTTDLLDLKTHEETRIIPPQEFVAHVLARFVPQGDRMINFQQ